MASFISLTTDPGNWWEISLLIKQRGVKRASKILMWRKSMGAAKGLTMSKMTGHLLRKLNSNLWLIKSDLQPRGEIQNGFIYTTGTCLVVPDQRRPWGFRGQRAPALQNSHNVTLGHLLPWHHRTQFHQQLKEGQTLHLVALLWTINLCHFCPKTFTSCRL